MSATPSPTPAAFDPHDPAYSKDPYPFYARLREHAPVLKVQPYGSWWVLRDADVRTVLEDTEGFTKANPLQDTLPPPPLDAFANLPPGVFMMDPPRHTVVRPILDRLLAGAIDGIEAVVAQQSRQLIDATRGSARFEFVQAFARPLPAQVLFTVMGMPKATAPLSGWVDGYIAGHDITASAGAHAAAGTCTFALQAYFLAMAAGGPACPRSGLFKGMMDSVGPQGMKADEVATTALNLAIAGYASTTYLLATGLLRLLQHPDQLAALRADPGLATNAVWEMLRYDAPAQLVDRYAARDTTLGGVKIRRGDAVTAVIGSANRDGARWPDPDRFDIRRDTTGQVGFGDGIHVCLGAPLVQRVAPVALNTLLQELPALCLAGTPQWQTDPYLRSVANLPLATA
jgi:cytochrome P450